MRQTEPVTRQSYWREIFRALKKTALGRKTVTLLGSTFRIAYEARAACDCQADYALLKNLASGKRCVFDVGANVGLTSLIMASSLAEGGAIYAFEVSEAACLVIRENLLLNHLENTVHVINTALWDEMGGLIDFNWDFICEAASALIQYPGRETIKLSKVCTTLDEISQMKGLRPDFIKIDVEGAEVHVVRGMRWTLQNVRPEIVLELHAWPGMTRSLQASNLLMVLREVGYQMVRLDTRELIQEGSELDQDATHRPLYSRCWVSLLPLEKELSTSVPCMSTLGM